MAEFSLAYMGFAIALIDLTISHKRIEYFLKGLPSRMLNELAKLFQYAVRKQFDVPLFSLYTSVFIASAFIYSIYISTDFIDKPENIIDMHNTNGVERTILHTMAIIFSGCIGCAFYHISNHSISLITHLSRQLLRGDNDTIDYIFWAAIFILALLLFWWAIVVNILILLAAYIIVSFLSVVILVPVGRPIAVLGLVLAGTSLLLI